MTFAVMEREEPMDNRLTSKDAITVLRNLQDWLYYSSMNGGTSIQREAIDIAIGALKQPEIVRCCDCKHHWTHKCMDSMPIERCDLEQTFYDAEVDYCSLAERRTDG